jgi:hypothetical protein
MQIRVTKGVAEVKLTKPELKKLHDVQGFVAAIPKGLPFEEERGKLEAAMDLFMNAVSPPADAPPY